MTDNLQQLYNNYLEFTDHMVGVHDAMEVAAVMMAQALSIYRTGLSDEEYNKMVDSISASRNRVHTFEKTLTQ
jgi:5-bromo-4-chloroindolyl phosphate hydrolysis protein